jgi:2-polyprenyl-3-methyl-5-hydroxy-6-metoxy-1,4-benzoquinol methylase
MRVLELSACPACGSEALETFEFGGHSLHRCTACELVSAPDYADPADVYVDGYMFGGAGQFGPGFDVRHPLFQRYLSRVAVRRIEMIERATGIRGGRLLDVGCGTGEVLLAGQERGWTAQGVEPERTGADVARARGLDVHVSRLEESGLPERSFDVVSAFHVLEHMPDSRAFLGTLARWARPGGFVTIEVPNWGSVQRRRLGPDWPHLRPREHLAYFTPDTLPRTLERSGIEPVRTRSPAYVGEPQTLGDALADLARQGRYRRLLEPLSPVRTVGGRQARYPGRLGWAVLRATEAIYDRAGVGTVVLCVGRVSGGA